VDSLAMGDQVEAPSLVYLFWNHEDSSVVAHIAASATTVIG